MRILALDYGKKRIGLAISDPLGITAQGLETFERTTIREDLARLAALVSRREVSLLLFGNPLHMSGAESRQSERVREFAARLSKACGGIPVEFWDERLTSVEANRVLRESGISLAKRVRQVDKLSAMLTLESYLESKEIAAEAAALEAAAGEETECVSR
ncbi:MAG: Holliday junction resolvase RuvX [Acidobacteria bacterium]|nr:Holliday junction resolvase RuvX [Acidobacteriota bacterium]